MISAAFYYTAYLCISYFNLGMWILIATGLITGFMGSYLVILTATLSYFADTTEPSDRGKVFIIGESSFFAGFAFGPLLGGYLARRLSHGPEDVFLIALVCKVVVFFSTLAFLPESLKNTKLTGNLESVTVSDRMRGTFRDVLAVFKAAMTPSFTYLMIGLMCVAAAGSGRSVFFFYVSFTFGWDSQDEGQYLLVASISRMVYMLIVYPLLAKVFSSLIATPKGKAKFDLNLIRVGVLIAAFCSLMQALSKKSWHFYGIALIDGFSTLASPTIQSLLSGNVPKSTQGLLFSGVSFITQIVGLLFGIIMPNIWAFTVKSQFANAFLFVVSSLYFCAGFAFVTGVSSKRILEGREKANETNLIETVDVNA
jgi:DHA1 family tetracycline resistance protein-like MFS transporter